MRKLLSALALLLSVPAWGQTTASTSPAPSNAPANPSVARAAPYAKWIIHYSYAEKKPSAAPAAPTVPPGQGANAADAPDHRVETITVTKTPGVIQQITLHRDGTREERWVIDRFLISLESDQARLMLPIRDRAPEDTLNVDFSRVDFQDFDWISNSNFKGVIAQGERKCLVFEDSANSFQAERLTPAIRPGPFGPNGKLPAPFKPAGMDYKAILDYQTHLPISLSHGDETRTYEYATPPTSALVPPDSIIQLVKDEYKMLSNGRAQAGRPF